MKTGRERTMSSTIRFSILAAALSVAAAPSISAGAEADPWREVAAAEAGGARAAMAAIDAQIRAAGADGLRPVEEKLLAILRSPGATAEGKEFACRALRLAGSDLSVPVLAALLGDERLDAVARLALQGMPGPKVDEALRAALPGIRGRARAGAVSTIGARRDAAAVPLLAPLAGDEDPAVAGAALHALGRIGGPEALAVLSRLSAPPALARDRRHAIILCAEGLAAAGKKAEAGAAFRSVLGESSSDPVTRIAALRGLVDRAGAMAAAEISSALRDPDRRVREAAAAIAARAEDVDLVAALLAPPEPLPADVRIVLLGLVEDRRRLFAILALDALDGALKAASMEALGRIGDARDVPALIAAAAEGAGDAREAARKGLRDLRGAGIDSALAAAARSGPAAGRAEALGAIGARGSSSSAEVILAAMEDPEPAVRSAAGAALAALAASARSPEERQAVGAAAASAIPGKSAEVRIGLIRLLPSAAGAAALGAVRKASEDPDRSVAAAAREALSSWPDPAALPDLVALAARTGGDGERTGVLRAVARLAALPGGPAPERKVELISGAMEAAGKDERKLLIAGLAGIPHPAALAAATGLLADGDLEVEAATAVVKIAAAVRKTDAGAADRAIARILETCKSPTARQVAESAQFVPAGLLDIASRGTASSPDGWEKDGEASGDAAAIDGDPGTYWDEVDGKDLYRLKVDLEAPRRIAAISILGWAHHNYAPKDFEILLDGVPVKKVVGARYAENFLVVRLDGTNAKTVELKITGYYGNSPAIRELGIYRPGGGR